ncbi:MAG: glycosyltransferase family 39 protein [Dehalococcoidia bacterium]|nr:glycosyltransferase family 39 protein [Dehalococcoidia bacterium]
MSAGQLPGDGCPSRDAGSHDMTLATASHKPFLNFLRVTSLLLVTFAASLYLLSDKSLFNDETFSIEVARLGPAELLSAMMSTEPQPPLYYLSFAVWLGVAGNGEFSSRYFSVLAGIALVAIIYRLALTLAGNRAAMFAIAIVALNPFLIYYAQYVRIYTVAPALAGATALSFFYAMRGGGRRRWAMVAGLTAVGGYVSYFNLLPSIFIGLVCLLQWLRLPRGPEKDAWRQSVLAHLAAGLILLPWLPVTWHYLFTLAPGVPRWRVFIGPLEMVQKTILAFALGHAVDLNGLPWLSLGAVAMGTLWAIGVLRTRPVGELLGRRLVSLILFGYQVFPLLVYLALSPIEPLFHERYSMITFPVFMATASLSFVSRRAYQGSGLARRVLGLFSNRGFLVTGTLGILLIVVVVGELYGLSGWYFDKRFTKDDFRGMIGYMEPRLRRGDAVLISAGYVRPSVDYYLHSAPAWRGPLMNLPTSMSGGPVLVQIGQIGEDADEANSSVPADSYYSWLSRRQATLALAKLSKAYQRIWLVRVYDTVSDPRSLVLPWLRDNLFELEAHEFDGTSYPQLYLFSTRRPPDRSLPEIEFPRKADLGSGIEFLGHDLETGQVWGGDRLHLRLYWRAAGKPDKDYVVFVHLLDYRRQGLAGVDNQPMMGRYPTSVWQPGEIVGDDFDLLVPPDSPPGLYTLEVGMYNSTTGQRLGNTDLDVDKIVVRQSATLPSSAQPVAYKLGNIELAGYEIPKEARAGSLLNFKLYWRAISQQAIAFTGFVHLWDASGALAAQSDGPPARGAFPTSAWPIGDLVADHRQLPLTGLKPGDYKLVVGLYDPATGQRLKSSDGTDSVALATIRLTGD